MGWKNCLFRKSKSFPFTESFTLCPQKPLVFATKVSLVWTTFYCPQKPPFHVQKTFFFTNLSLLLSKATLFHPPSPIRTTLNLLFAKYTAVLLISNLISYAVKPERRTDSNHCRRCPETCSFQHRKIQFSIAPKLTSSHDFYPRQPTVSLQYTFSFS